MLCIGAAPITKNGVHIIAVSRGMIPITKNIAVTDQSGIDYEPTYLRRAKGLVKSGRARWVDEEHICLTCPPERFETEDNNMNENQIAYIKEQIEFLKADLNREIPLNFGSELQPENARRIEEMRDETRKKILIFLDQLSNPDKREEEKQYYRNLLEKMISDRATLNMVEQAEDTFGDDDCKKDMILAAVSSYEMSKREIARMILEKLG
jgi:hypothetical protein